MNGEHEHKQYLGDGLYAAWDGWHIVLTAENGVSVTNEVYLEPDVLQRFDEYRETLKQVLSAPPPEAYDPDDFRDHGSRYGEGR